MTIVRCGLNDAMVYWITAESDFIWSTHRLHLFHFMSYLFNLVNFQIAGDGLSTITVEEGQYTLNVSPSGKPIFAHGILELGITHLESGICRHFLPK